MTNNDLTALDEFIDPTHQRDITRVVRFLLYRASSLHHVLIFGNQQVGVQLLQSIVERYPIPNVPVVLVGDGGKYIQSAGSTDKTVLETGTTASVLRSLLRQDPDTIATTDIDAESLPILIQSALTGHQIMFVSNAPSVEATYEALTALSAVDPYLLSAVQVEVAIEVEMQDALPRIRRILYRANETLEELLRVEEGNVVLQKSLLPEVQPSKVAHTPVFAPAVETWPQATIEPRSAFIPVVEEGVGGRSCIGGNHALRPRGGDWPVCKKCGEQLSLLLQLDLANLPAPLHTSSGIAQLFVCKNIPECEAYTETDPGIHAEVIFAEDLEEHTAVAVDERMIVAPGAIVGWKAYTEDPQPSDLSSNLKASDSENNALSADSETAPRYCDKLGGWPAWQQQNDWPRNEDQTPMTLLFQISEGWLLQGGKTASWNYQDATYIEPVPGEAIVDPNFPRHFSSVWSGDATALLFIDAEGKRLALRVQMG